MQREAPFCAHRFESLCSDFIQSRRLLHILQSGNGLQNIFNGETNLGDEKLYTLIESDFA